MKAFVTDSEREILRQAKRVRAGINKRVRSARPKHKPSAGQRQPRERDNEHLKLIRRLPCLATLIREGREVYGVDAAHVRHGYPVKGWGGNPGMGAKPSDFRALPLTRASHREQHSMNEAAFWRALNVDPPTVCFALRDAKDFEAMLLVIRSVAIAAGVRRNTDREPRA